MLGRNICSIRCFNVRWHCRCRGKDLLTYPSPSLRTTGALLLFYLLHVIEKFHVIPWMLIELIYCGVWAFFFFTAAVDAAVKAKHAAALGAAAFFGFVAMGVYGYDAFLKFQAWRAGQLGQGQRTVQQSNVEVASPAY